MLADFWQSVLDTIRTMAADPSIRTEAVLGSILLVLTTMAVRRRKPLRTRINVDAPPGTRVKIDTDDRPELKV